MPLTVSQFEGRSIRILGAADVDLGTSATYPIFTIGAAPNIAPDRQTIVAYCIIMPKILKPWDTADNTFLINNPPWEAQTLNLKNYESPAVVYAAGRPQSASVAFTFQVVTGNSKNGIASVLALGWTI